MENRFEQAQKRLWVLQESIQSETRQRKDNFNKSIKETQEQINALFQASSKFRQQSKRKLSSLKQNIRAEFSQSKEDLVEIQKNINRHKDQFKISLQNLAQKHRQQLTLLQREIGDRHWKEHQKIMTAINDSNKQLDKCILLILQEIGVVQEMLQNYSFLRKKQLFDTLEGTQTELNLIQEKIQTNGCTWRANSQVMSRVLQESEIQLGRYLIAQRENRSQQYNNFLGELQQAIMNFDR